MRPPAERRTQWLLVALTLTSYAFFMQAGGWNHNSRFDVARALVEQHTLSIDAYRHNTGDLALWGSHYYSDKAPLTGVVAAVPYAAIYALRPLLPAAWQAEPVFLRIASYFVTLCVSGLAAALTTLLLFRFARQRGCSARGAAGVALVYGMASFAFPFATVLFGHDLAAALLFGSLYCGTRAAGWKGNLVAGLLAGLASFAEYPTVGASLVIVIYLCWRRGRADWAGVLAAFTAGALLPGLLAAGYAWVCFHDVLAVGYRNVALGDIGKTSWFGLSRPHLEVVGELLFGPRRGLFLGSPALALCGVGLALGLWRRADRERWLLSCACGGIFVYYVVFISSYQWWDGGWSFGPRHVIPMLPFLCLGGVAVADRWPRIFFATTLVSALVMLAGTAHSPLSEPNESLLASAARTVAGDVGLRSVLGVVARGESTNAGLLFGLQGVSSVLPLLSLWAIFGLALWQSTPAASRPVPEAGSTRLMAPPSAGASATSKRRRRADRRKRRAPAG